MYIYMYKKRERENNAPNVVRITRMIKTIRIYKARKETYMCVHVRIRRPATAMAVVNKAPELVCR